MTFIGNIWANLQIFASNYNYSYGHLTNILLLTLVVCALILGVIRAFKLPKLKKERVEVVRREAEEITCRNAGEALSRAIKCKTTPDNQGGFDDLINFLELNYKSVFARSRSTLMPNGGLVICWQGSQRDTLAPVLFSAHTDVLPPMGNWKHGPFSGEDDGVNIWGRGAINAKGVIISQLEAVKELIGGDFTPTRDIYFAYGCDAETGGAKGAGEIAEYFRKKQLKFDFILDRGNVITTSHLGNKLFPVAAVGVGEKSSINVKLTAKGKGGHSSKPPKHTVVGHLAEAVCRIENAPVKKRLLPEVLEYLRLSSPSFNLWQRFIVANHRVMKPFMKGAFKHHNEVLSLLGTTFASTVIKGSVAPNMLPEEAEAIVNVRLLQGDTVANVESFLKSLMGDLPISFEISGKLEPSKISSYESMAFDTISRNIREHFEGVTVMPTISTSTTDTRYYGDFSDNIFRFSPFLLSPKQEKSIHSSDECISKDALGTAIEFYKALLRIQ